MSETTRFDVNSAASVRRQPMLENKDLGGRAYLDYEVKRSFGMIVVSPTDIRMCEWDKSGQKYNWKNTIGHVQQLVINDAGEPEAIVKNNDGKQYSKIKWPQEHTELFKEALDVIVRGADLMKKQPNRQQNVPVAPEVEQMEFLG